MVRDHAGLQIVVIEDEALIVMDLELIIEAEGHRMVADAPSVPALHAIDPDLDVDVAFVDLHLADDTSGFEAADHIRRTWPDAVIVFVTANPRMLLPEIARGDAVVPKPFSTGMIEAVLAFLHDATKQPPPRVTPPNGFRMRPGYAARLGHHGPAAPRHVRRNG